MTTEKLGKDKLISSRINSRLTRRPTGLTTILHNNRNIRLLCKIAVRPIGRLDRLELMREDQVLSSHSFYGFDKNVFFYNIIKPKLKTIKYNVIPIKNKMILGRKKSQEENSFTCNAAC